MDKEYTWRWLFFFVGIMTMSLGVTMTIKGNVIGTGPWDVLHIGLFKQFGLTIGTWSILAGFIILTTTSLFLKQWPRLATWLNMLLVGSFIDFFNWLLPNTTHQLFIGLYFVCGLLVSGMGCGMYIAANLGAGPRDTIMMIIVDKFGGSVRKARIFIDVIVATTGWLLGGPIGVGTVILALGLGYVIQPALFYFRNQLEKKLA